MAEQPGGRWAHIRAGTLVTPARRARYERTKQQVLTTRQLLLAIDTERERQGLTKAELAHCIGATPSVVRRLFSSASSNPTLGTVVALFEVLDLEVEVRYLCRHSLSSGV